MRGFLEIGAVANVTGYAVEEIERFVDTKQIPHNVLPDGQVLFPVADIEKWKQTHKPAKPVAKAVASNWSEGDAANMPDPGDKTKKPNPQGAVKAPKAPKPPKE